MEYMAAWTPVTLFPNQYNKVNFYQLIYAKATKNPLKDEKKSIFSSHGQWHSYENIFHHNACECHGSVNITVYNSMDTTNWTSFIWCGHVFDLCKKCIEIGFENDMSGYLVTEWSNASVLKLNSRFESCGGFNVRKRRSFIDNKTI